MMPPSIPDPSSEPSVPHLPQGQNGDSPTIAGDETTSLSLVADGARGASTSGAQTPAGQSLSVVTPEAADDASMREFYSQLVTLLTQDSTATPKKKSRNTLLATLRRRWLPALLVSGLSFLGLIYLLRPRQSTYQANVTLLLPPRTMTATQDPFSPPEESYDTQAELAIIGSDDIVRTAMSNVPPKLRLRGWGSRNVQVVPIEADAFGSNSLLNINVSSLDPAASLRLSLEMVRAYTGYTRRRYEQNREENLEITRKRVTESSRLLENARSQLRNYKERTGVFDATSQQGSSSGSIGELENALAKARSEAAAGSEAESLVQDERLVALRQQALEAQTRYQNVLRDFLPSSPRASSAEREWRGAAAAAAARSSEITTGNNRRRAQLEASLRAARSRAAALPAIEQSLNRLNERVQLLQTAYRTASDRYNQLSLAGGTVAPTARVLHSPSVGSSRLAQWIRAVAVSLLAALGLGVLGAWLANRFDRSVRTISEPNALFDVPILGVMPATGGKSGLHLSGMITKRGRSALHTATIEACYTTQNNLLAAAKTFGAQSILLTSAVPREGKSQCASNLATAMAYGGQTVLLIDADFLHPSQHEILKMSLEPGYAQVLQDGLSLSVAIRPTHVPNLSLLAAGKNALKNPEAIVSLLGGAAHQGHLKALGRLYDVIVIDGPPAMSMADAKLLSNMADAIVLVTAEGTHQEEVYRARSMLRLAGGLLLGVIVNSVNLKDMGGWNLDFTPEAPFSNYAHSLRQRSS